MDSNNIWFKVIVGVILVGYMAFIFYQSLKGGIAYKKQFENFKNSHKHYETVVDGAYWVWVMVAMAVFGLLLWYVWRYEKNPRRRAALICLFALIIAMIGISRIYLGAHYASDVLGGFCVSMIWLVLYTKVIAPALGLID